MALILQALDFSRDTQIYIASGEIYGSERRLAALRDAFPRIVSQFLCAHLYLYVPACAQICYQKMSIYQQYLGFGYYGWWTVDRSFKQTQVHEINCVKCGSL